MARIAGKEIPDDKKIKVSLTYLYGIGESLSEEVLEKAGINGDTLTSELTNDHFAKIRNILETQYEVEGELRQKVKRNIRRLQDIRCYRGIRHKLGLPVRGQRTRHNARTRKGKSRPVGGLKRVITKT